MTECLVLYLPAGPSACGEFGYIVGTNRKISNEAVAIGHLTAGIKDLDLEPIDLQGEAQIIVAHDVTQSGSDCAQLRPG